MAINRQNKHIRLQSGMVRKKLSPEDVSRRKRIGENLKRLRIDAGIERQQDLADKLGLTRNYIGRLESGHASFGSDAERKFSKFFGVDISEFYKGAITSDIDQELTLLKKEVMKYGGVEKLRRLRKMIPALFNEGEENTPVPPKESKKRSA